MLVISSLACGGAERVMSTMANYWAQSGWHVALVTLDSTSTDFFPVHPSVQRIGLGVSGISRTPWQALRSNVVRVARLRDAIRASRPEVIVSFMPPTTMLCIVAGWMEGVPVVVSERTDPRKNPLHSFWVNVRRVTYPKAGAVVVQTPEVRAWAEGFVAQNRIHIVPNFVTVPHPVVEADPSSPAETATRTLRHVIAMGRLDAQKGFDILVRAFAQCRANRPEWRLTILGDGEERQRLEQLVRELDLTSVVRLPGRVADPVPALRGADLFVLSSRFEGFPNALLEAMAVGLPVIATDCASGPGRIVNDGVDGVLVPSENVGAMASAMAMLMDDESLRTRLGAHATAVTERFTVGAVMNLWESVLRDATGRHATQAHRENV